MVHYIRLLKSPKVQSRSQGSRFVTALITVTTDLGDSFLAEDVQLQAVLIHEQTRSVINNHLFLWKAGWREYMLAIPMSPEDASKSMILRIGTRQSNPHQLLRNDIITVDADMPVVIAGWSAPFGGPHNTSADPLIERRLEYQPGSTLSIWEENGNNFARHIW